MGRPAQVISSDRLSCSADALLLSSLTSPTALQFASIKSSTVKSYSSAVRSFATWLSNHRPGLYTIPSLDAALAEYGTVLFDDNPRRGERQNFINTICGIEFFVPCTRRLLQESRLAAKGWDKLVPSRSPPPLPPSVVYAISGFYSRRGNKLLAVAFHLAFNGYLRSLELLNIRVGDIALPGDARLDRSSSAVNGGCVVRDAKTGSNQFVPLDDMLLLKRLRILMNDSDLGSNELLFPYSYAALSLFLSDALEHLRLGHIGYTLHSLRHGGATRDFLEKVDVADIMVKGRWLSDSSCRRYLNAGKGLLLTVQFSDEAKRRIKYYSSSWKNARL